jgi:hypothetical protein
MTISDIVTNIDQRIAAAHAEVTHLTHARSALLSAPSAPSAAAPPKPPRARRPATRPKTAAKRALKPAYEVVPVGKLTALLTESQGLSTREISRATNGDPRQVLTLLKDQETAGQFRRTGTRAATRWHVITDEDRIAARAAELTARSRQTRVRKS